MQQQLQNEVSLKKIKMLVKLTNEWLFDEVKAGKIVHFGAFGSFTSKNNEKSVKMIFRAKDAK